MSDVLLISGSPSVSSKSKALFDYATQRFTAENLTVAAVSVRDYPAADLLLAKHDSPAFDGLKKLLADVDGLVVSTPVYKAAYSGALKTLLDILPPSALRGKTVLPLATGGSPAHLLALDYALKPVLSVLGATDLLQGVYVVNGQVRTGADGQTEFDDELRGRLDAALGQLAANVKLHRSSRLS